LQAAPGVLSKWQLMNTPERVAEVRRLRAEGVSRRDIARMLGTSKSAVVGLCTRHNIPSPDGVTAKHPHAYDRPAVAAQMRALVAAGKNVYSAARALGIGNNTAQAIAAEFKIAPPPKWRPEYTRDTSPHAEVAPPNMRLSEAQRAHVDQQKRAQWMANRQPLLPPPSDDEAAAAVAAFLARRSVTVCPPGFAAAVNNGRGL
jgi:hypothetical protein